MSDAQNENGSWGDLLKSEGILLLIVYCSGVWLFAADGLMVSTMLPKIVPEIGGAELIGWAGALFQALSIVSGAFSVFMVRKWHISNAFYISVVGLIGGCLISALAPNMPLFQLGRLFQAFFGGALVAIAHIGVTQIIEPHLRVKAFALISIVWGGAAFSAPLVGGLFAQNLDWRHGFTYASLVAVAVGLGAFIGYRRQADAQNSIEISEEKFPATRLAYLTLGVGLIATASLIGSISVAILCVILGIIATVAYVIRDAKSGDTALLPAGSFDISRPISQVLAFIFFGGAATIAMGVFGPVLLSVGYGLSPIQTGYLLFMGAAGWTLMAALWAGVKPDQEPMIIGWAALAIVASAPIIALGFYLDAVWLIAAGLFIDGAGFGACWALVLRRAAQHPDQKENERITSAISTVHRAGLAFGAAFLSILCNQLGFSENMSAAMAQNIGLWMMILSGVFGIPALWAAIKFVQVREDQIHAR